VQQSLLVEHSGLKALGALLGREGASTQLRMRVLNFAHDLLMEDGGRAFVPPLSTEAWCGGALGVVEAVMEDPVELEKAVVALSVLQPHCPQGLASPVFVEHIRAARALYALDGDAERTMAINPVFRIEILGHLDGLLEKVEALEGAHDEL
jgi:hypothetical protein